MSVLINMDMPRNCGECWALDEWWGDYPLCLITQEQGGFKFPKKEQRMRDCPLIEVPEPHGRLIDASEEIMVQTYDDQYEEWRQTKMTIDDLLCVGWVEAEAPTVIPASEVET